MSGLRPCDLCVIEWEGYRLTARLTDQGNGWNYRFRRYTRDENQVLEEGTVLFYLYPYPTDAWSELMRRADPWVTGKLPLSESTHE